MPDKVLQEIVIPAEKQEVQRNESTPRAIPVLESLPDEMIDLLARVVLDMQKEAKKHA